MATQALSIDPNNFHSLYLAGMARESLNDDDHAIASLQRATEIKQDSDVTSFIGYIYLYKKNDAEKAISLADAYVSLHDVKKAKEAYFRILGLTISHKRCIIPPKAHNHHLAPR